MPSRAYRTCKAVGSGPISSTGSPDPFRLQSGHADALGTHEEALDAHVVKTGGSGALGASGFEYREPAGGLCFGWGGEVPVKMSQYYVGGSGGRAYQISFTLLGLRQQIEKVQASLTPAGGCNNSTMGSSREIRGMEPEAPCNLKVLYVASQS